MTIRWALRPWTRGCASTVLVLAAACSSANPAPATSGVPPSSAPAGMQPYISRTFGFTIEYPDGWQKQTSVTGVAFLAPAASGSDGFRENVNVLEQDLTAEPMTLEQYTNLSLSQMRQLGSDAEIISQEAVPVGGQPGEQVEYAGTVGGRSLRFFQAWTVVGNRAHVLTYTADPGDYDSYLETAKEIFASFAVS